MGSASQHSSRQPWKSSSISAPAGVLLDSSVTPFVIGIQRASCARRPSVSFAGLLPRHCRGSRCTERLLENCLIFQKYNFYYFAIILSYDRLSSSVQFYFNASQNDYHTRFTLNKNAMNRPTHSISSHSPDVGFNGRRRSHPSLIHCK